MTLVVSQSCSSLAGLGLLLLGFTEILLLVWEKKKIMLEAAVDRKACLQAEARL